MKANGRKNHRIQRSLYNRVILPLGYGALSAAARFHRKLKRTLDGRRDIRSRWSAAAEHLTGHPVWFHAASVGEYEQARPVIARVRRNHPGVPIAVTFSSPSGFEYATRAGSSNDGLEFVEYLPVDFAANARFCLETLDPRLLVFVKFDLWPNLIWEAKARGVSSVLIDGTLSRASRRGAGLGRRFYRAVYADIDRILAISEADAARFRRCVPSHTGIAVAGDTRFDRVKERKLGRGVELPIDTAGRFVVVAGSTWPADERRLLPAIARLSKTATNLLVVLAPHEPAPARVSELAAWARSEGFETEMLGGAGRLRGTNGNRAVIVDTVGVLAETYRIADVAYVGGAFSTGVHNVIEPAIMGIPVLFGPKCDNSFEAVQLLRHGGAACARSTAEIYRELESTLRDPGRRRAAGERAEAYVESQLGASERCMEVIDEYISTPSGDRVR